MVDILMENKAKLINRIENLTVFLVGIYLVLLPLIISTISTDAFIVPKQAILAVVVFAGLILLGVKSVLNEGVRLRRTPFDLPLILFTIAALISAVLAVNRYDSFISFVPFMFAVLLYFVITNSVRKSQDFLFLTGSLIVGAIAISAITLLSYLKIYIIPFEFAKFQTFTPFGSLFDQAIYLALILVLCLYMAWPSLKKRSIDKSRLVYLVGAFVLVIGLAITAVATFTLQKPQLLPAMTGFQTAFAAISQDNTRVVQGFLSGSGIGTFLVDFNKFKPASFNLYPDLWNLTFLRSSSFFLELIATTGLLGVITFLFLVWRIIRTKPLFPPIILGVILAFILPFSYTVLVLFFVLLAIYSAQQGLSDRQKTKFFDVELKLLSLRRGVFALDDPKSRRESNYGNFLPIAFLIVTIVFTALVGIPTAKFVYSDYLFQKSLVAAAANDAQSTYDLQMDALKWFPERDGYNRIFSQVNLSLANNIASSIPQGASPSAEQSNTIYQLIQNSINYGRQATVYAPQNAANWQNLASIYRSLIGFGQNADSFAVLATQQSVLLDPNNPQQYINYGGIFYQLGRYDDAIRQFQIAANLKPDFANAYYNLGHAYEQKGDLQTALEQYQRVRSLVAQDRESVKQIDQEISTLQSKIGKANQAGTANNTGTANVENQPDLGVDQPAAQLPAQKNPVKIPGPTETPTKTPTPTPEEE